MTWSMEELQRKHDGCLSFAASETLEKAEVQNNLILKCRIEKAIRRIVKRVKLEEFLAHILRGEDLPDWETKVRGEFNSFIQEQSTFNARQIEMLNALCNYVIDNEVVAKRDLVYLGSFTQIHQGGLPGVFGKSQIDEILSFTEALTV